MTTSDPHSPPPTTTTPTDSATAPSTGHNASIRIEVTTRYGTVEARAECPSTREALRLTLAQLSAHIDDSRLANALGGQSVRVEQDPECDGRTIVTCSEMDATVIERAAGHDWAVWLPNEDGYDGSRVYSDQLAAAIAVLNQVACLPRGATDGS